MKKIKTERINFVISESDRLIIKNAAERIDVSESELIRRAALVSANKILASPDGLDIPLSVFYQSEQSKEL